MTALPPSACSFIRERQWVRVRWRRVLIKSERILQRGGMQSDGDRSSVRLVPGRTTGPRHVYFQLGHLRRFRDRLSGRSLHYRAERLGFGELFPLLLLLYYFFAY